jgi:hypothetical protein
MRTKVKSFETKEYNGKKSYTVTLENGVSGYLNAQGSDTIGEGNEVDYTLEVKKNKKGGEYNLLTVKLVPANVQNSVQTETKAAPTKVQVPTTALQTLKAQAVVKAMEFMINTFIADKITWDQIQPKFKELTGYLIDGIEECNKE